MKNTKRYIAFFLAVLMLFSSIYIGFAIDETVLDDTSMEPISEDSENIESEQNEVIGDEMESITDSEAENLILDDSEIVDPISNNADSDSENLDGIDSETETLDANDLNEDSESDDAYETVRGDVEVLYENDKTETDLPENSDGNISDIEDIAPINKVNVEKNSNSLPNEIKENIAIEKGTVEKSSICNEFHQFAWSSDFSYDGYNYYCQSTKGKVTIDDEKGVYDYGVPALFPNHSGWTKPNSGTFYAPLVTGANNIVNVTVENSGDGLKINFKPGTKTGITTVKVSISFYYTTTGIYQETVPGNLYFWYTVINTVGLNIEEQPPEKPIISDLPANSYCGYVDIMCVTYPKANPHYNSTRKHSKFMSLSNSTNGWSFGEVYENDGRFGDDVPKDDYPYFCDLIVDKDWYLYQYNRNYASSEGTHYLDNPNEVVSATFVYDANENEWLHFIEDFPLTVWTTHEKQIINADYQVEWYDASNNKLLKSETRNGVIGNTVSVTDADKIIEGYIFDARNAGNILSEKLTSETVLKLYFTKNTSEYIVTYTDGVYGKTVFPDQSYEGQKEGDKTPTFVGKIEREGYTFMGWTPVVADTINPDMADDDNEIIYTATWLKNPTLPIYYYTVTYTDGVDGTVFLDETYSTLDDGSPTPVFTKNLNRKGYKFIGWKLISVDSNATEIQPTVEAEDANEDRTIIYEAQWEETKYQIGWYDEDKLTQLDKNTFLEEEEESSYSKELPTKEEDERYTYIFKEWILQETPLNDDDISYVASYTPIPKKYGYTIEHQYYTDGELDATETISDSAELDEIINSSDFEVVENYKDNIYQFLDVTSSELKITVSKEDNKIIFRYGRFSYKVVHQYLNENGDLDGQTENVFYSVKDEEIIVDSIKHKILYNDETYPYVSDSGNLVISDNVADNVITIIYQKEKQLPKETTYIIECFDTEEHLLKEETRTGFVEETKVPNESDYIIDGYIFLPKYKDNILSVTLKEDSSENVLILYFSKHQEKEEFSSYEIEHQYYVKDKNGNLKLEGAVKETVGNIKVGTTVTSSSIAKKYHYGNNVYEFLSASDNIVIEKDSHSALILKYVRTKQEDTNITVTEENKKAPPKKDEPVEEVEPKEEVVVIQETNTISDSSEQVKTGDNAPIIILLGLILISGMGICFLKKKR